MPRPTETQDAARPAQQRRGQTLDGRFGRWSLSADSRPPAFHPPETPTLVDGRVRKGATVRAQGDGGRCLNRADSGRSGRGGSNGSSPPDSAIRLCRPERRVCATIPAIRPSAGRRQGSTRISRSTRARFSKPVPSTARPPIPFEEFNTDAARPESAFAGGFPPGAAHSLTRGGVSGFGGERRNSSRSRIPSSDTQATSQNASM